MHIFHHQIDVMDDKCCSSSTYLYLVKGLMDSFWSWRHLHVVYKKFHSRAVIGTLAVIKDISKSPTLRSYFPSFFSFIKVEDLIREYPEIWRELLTKMSGPRLFKK